MKSNPLDKIIYSICIEDVQQVAEEQFGRKLKKEELEIVENEIGDYFGWYDAIESCIQDKVIKKK